MQIKKVLIFGLLLVSSLMLAQNNPPPPLPPLPPHPAYATNSEENSLEFENSSFSSNPPAPGEGAAEGGDLDDIPMSSAFDYTNGLWLGIFSANTNWMTLVLHGTYEDEFYEVLTKTNLGDATWNVANGFLGTDDMTLVPSISVGQTNKFFWARHSSLDTDGDGLPDWWELEHGYDPEIANGYGDEDGDGWTNLEEMQSGTNPAQFNTPRAPQGLKAILNSSHTEASLSWQPNPGNVTGYSIQRWNPGYWGPEDNFSVSTVTNFTDATLTVPESVEEARRYHQIYYQIRANYVSGSSEWSAPARVSGLANPAIARVARSTSGILKIILSSIPENATQIKVTKRWFDYQNQRHDGSFTIPLSAFTNGTATLPETEFLKTQTYDVWLQTVDNAGNEGTVQSDFVGREKAQRFPFYDGREHMKENLSFLLRAAFDSSPFRFYTHDESFHVYFPETAISNYVWAGLYRQQPTITVEGATGDLDEYLPFIENSLYRNFVFAPSEMDSGFLPDVQTVPLSPYQPWVSQPSRYVANVPDDNSPAPLLTPETDRWLYASHISIGEEANVLGNTGLYFDEEWNLFMASGVKNYFGLKYLSHRSGAFNTNEFPIITPAGGDLQLDRDRFTEVEEPILQTVGYYFGRTLGGYNGHLYPLPGTDSFSVTNTTPLLILKGNIQSDDKPVRVIGFAKQTILNGDSNKFAYLGQYFTNAWKADTNGGVGTNKTGILSEYGDFLPTEPGKAWLETMPNFGETNFTYCPVYTIKLELDVNHDGTIDRTITGPDNTSYGRPFVFWVNNDSDVHDKDIYTPSSNPLPDYADKAILCARGLEDLARLWISGLSVLDSSYEVKLSMINVSGTPSINLYNYDVEANGGAGYLTDTNVANAIMTNSNNRVPLSTIDESSTYTFPSGFFANAEKRHFIFEGAEIGKGELVLTVRKGAKVIGETSVWLDLRDVKQMYEGAVIDNISDGVPNLLVSRYRMERYLSSPSDEAKQIILNIHGFNNTPWQSESYAQTMFKRLYWQGYQGRYLALRWPTRMDIGNYNASEHKAFYAGEGVAALLENLRQRFPDYTINVAAHSMGNIVMMQALKRLNTLGLQPVDNYVLMEAAVPAQCYDSNAPPLATLFQAEALSATPDTYLSYLQLTNLVRGSIINFYSEDDFALRSWVANQVLNKPDSNHNFWSDGTLGYRDEIPIRIISEPKELMPFVARPRTRAVGAEELASGVIDSRVNLKTQFGFDTRPGDHSGQYTRSIQVVWPFYSRFLIEILP